MKLLARPDDRGLRIDVFLAARLDRVTRSHIQALNRSGAVLINGSSEKDGYRVRGDEVIEIDLRSDTSTTLEPHAMDIEIHYEDEDFAVIEKPAGVVVHPGAGTTNNTIVHGLLHQFNSLSKAGGGARPGIVHRLDKWTSGLLIVAKNDWVHAQLSRAFQERKIQKTYTALVHGRLPQQRGEISLSIGRHRTIRTRMSAHSLHGRPAFSSYVVLEEIRSRNANTAGRSQQGIKEFSLLDVRIATGRTHQIRVHLSAIGHPVVGDDVYGENKAREFAKKYGPMGRYFLHASELSLMHPKTNVALKFKSDLPAELQTLLERIRN
jgi:23S rRNA pseudouridine1911/1915/1917 synthase